MQSLSENDLVKLTRDLDGCKRGDGGRIIGAYPDDDVFIVLIEARGELSVVVTGERFLATP